MAPKIVDKKLKKLEILHVAMEVFAENGFANTRMQDIAKKAGIGKGTIYEYFKNKNEIFLTAFDSLITMMNENFKKILQLDKNPIEKLKLLIKTSTEHFEENNGELTKIILDFWAEGIRNREQKKVQVVNLKEIYAKYRETLNIIFKEGVDKNCFRKIDLNSLSSLVIAAIDGIMLQFIMDPEVIDLDLYFDNMIDTILKGIVVQTK